MTQTRKEKGVAQLKQMLNRWEDMDGEFRQYISWRMETLKLIGAGNTSGLFAIAVFLTAGIRTDGIVGAGKFCLFLFFIGFGAFFLAYRTLYRCAGHIEDGLIAMRGGSDVSSKGVNESVSNAIDESERSGVLVMISTISFVVASVMAIVGLLLS
jgi:hypothetical protein